MRQGQKDMQSLKYILFQNLERSPENSSLKALLSCHLVFTKANCRTLLPDLNLDHRKDNTGNYSYLSFAITTGCQLCIIVLNFFAYLYDTNKQKRNILFYWKAQYLILKKHSRMKRDGRKKDINFSAEWIKHSNTEIDSVHSVACTHIVGIHLFSFPTMGS